MKIEFSSHSLISLETIPQIVVIRVLGVPHYLSFFYMCSYILEFDVYQYVDKKEQMFILQFV